MYQPDLSHLNLSTFEQSVQLIAVGWLERGQEYTRGEVESSFVQRLAELLLDPCQPGVFMGRHECSFCRFSGGPATFRISEVIPTLQVHVGVSNLWIPADGYLYVCPSLILHYMDAHEYAPPEVFQNAVMDCPPMRSMQYLRAIIKNGPKGLANKNSIKDG